MKTVLNKNELSPIKPLVLSNGSSVKKDVVEIAHENQGVCNSGISSNIANLNQVSDESSVVNVNGNIVINNSHHLECQEEEKTIKKKQEKLVTPQNSEIDNNITTNKVADKEGVAKELTVDSKIVCNSNNNENLNPTVENENVENVKNVLLMDVKDNEESGNKEEDAHFASIKALKEVA